MINLPKLQAKLKQNVFSRILLWILSLIYRCVIFLRRRLYRAGILKSFSLPAKVVCFGNITTGGTGKTSAVMMAASMLSRDGIRTAILTRGYGRPDKKKPVVILCREDPATQASWADSIADCPPPSAKDCRFPISQGIADCGDEAWMMHQSLEGLNVPVIVSRDRYRSGLVAVNQFQSQVILLDDGFQHFRLRRNMDIVLIDARNPFGGGSLLPLGSLRESKKGIRRAQFALITHCDQINPEVLESIRNELLFIHPGIRICTSVHQPEFFLDLCNSGKIELKSLKGPAAALSAIGSPESFEQTLVSLGLNLKQIWRYPDHHSFTMEELDTIQTVRGGYPLITTFKDFPRFPKDWRNVLAGKVYALSVRLRLIESEDILMKALTPQGRHKRKTTR